MESRPAKKDSVAATDDPFVRHLECLTTLADRHGRCKGNSVIAPSLVYFKKHPGARLVFEDGLKCSLIVLQGTLCDGNFFKQFVREFRLSNDGYNSDKLREFGSCVLKGLAYLHDCDLAVGEALKEEGIRFLPGQGQGMRPVLSDFYSAAVGKPRRNYDLAERLPEPAVRCILQGKVGQLVKIAPVSPAEVARCMGTCKLPQQKQTLGLFMPEEDIAKVMEIMRIDEQQRDVSNNPELTVMQALKILDVQKFAEMHCRFLLESDDQELQKSLKSASGPNEMARLLQCPENGQRDANKRTCALLCKMFNNNPGSRVSAERAAKSHAMQMPLLTKPQATELASGGIEVPGGKVPCFDKVSKPRFAQGIAPPLRLKPKKHGKKPGMGTFAACKIKKFAFVTSYSGEQTGEANAFSIYTLSLLRGLDRLRARYSSDWTLERYIIECAIGHILNSSRVVSTKRKAGNVYLDLSQAVIDDNGNMKVPMFALRDIEEGEELVWCYDWKAGACEPFKTDSTSENDD